MVSEAIEGGEELQCHHFLPGTRIMAWEGSVDRGQTADLQSREIACE